jgi:outer membrane protein
LPAQKTDAAPLAGTRESRRVIIHLLFLEEPPSRHPGKRMSRFRGRTVIMLGMLVAEGVACAQKAPAAPDHPWDASAAKQSLKAPPQLVPAPILDPAKIYTLSELVNIAEQNNPDTRVAWQNAKARAAELGIAESTLVSDAGGCGPGRQSRNDIFFGPDFQRQTVETFLARFSSGLRHL